MKPVPVTRLARRLDNDTTKDSVRNPMIPSVAHLQPGGSTPPQSRPAPIFMRDARSPDRRSDIPQRPVFARPPDRTQNQPQAPSPQSNFLVQLDQAYERGVSEGRLAERQEHERKATADALAWREQAVLERVEFQLNEYAKLEASITSALEELELRVSSAVARILTSYLETHMVDDAIAELAASLRRVVSNRSSQFIRIRGPEALLARLAKSTETFALAFEFVPEDCIEVTVEADETMIATQLEHWGELLRTLHGV